jgi:predicted dehydrogenase
MLAAGFALFGGNMEALRLGLVGCGDIAFRSYLPAIKEENQRVRLVAACDVTRQRAERAAAEYGPAEVFTDYREMLAKADIDGVMVLTPMVPHGPISIAALEAGKHVYVEKPMAVEVSQANRMVELSEARNLMLSCAPSTILLSPFRQLKQWVDSQEVGKIVFAHAYGAHGGPARWDGYTSDPTWFYQKGAGPLFDLAVYPTQILTQVFGPVQRVSAFARLAIPELTMTAEPVRGQVVRPQVSDTIVIILQFAGGLLATLDCSFNLLNSRLADMQFFGERGGLTAPEFLGGDVGLWHKGDKEWQVTRPPQTLYDRLGVAAGLPEWLDSIAAGKQPINNARHARHVVEILTSCQKSSDSGQAIDMKTSF